jgi:succinylarginine dihydrolase
MIAYEVNFDGLVGPTHNYAGLSYGNVASYSNVSAISNPKEAALQGLEKMKALHDLGFKQGVLPPHERPAVAFLRAWGFAGQDAQVMAQAARKAPELLAQISSASAMWTANAATVSPSADTADGRLHFTVANLNNKLHRSIEHETTEHVLQAIFNDAEYFAVHKALHSVAQLGDEGAANHTRFCHQYGDTGVEFFVYGTQALNTKAPAPKRYPARQTLEASQSIARIHGLTDRTAVFAQQNPDVIDQGVFHNDVISVGNRNVLFYHQEAFLNIGQVIDEIGERLQGTRLVPICVTSEQVQVQDAVTSYLFNSQLLSVADDNMLLVVPGECQENPQVWAYLQSLPELGTPIKAVQVYDVKQSMRNGGGPACLRLRVVLTPEELEKMNTSVLLTETLYTQLVDWVKRHYRDRLGLKDLADPALLNESRTALEELTKILQLGRIYPFQK